MSGPPEAPLAALVVTLEGEKLAIRPARASRAGELLVCDYCVAASNVRGIRELVKASSLDSPGFSSHVASLGESDPYAVYRLWLDRPLESSDFPFYTVSGYTYTDSVSIYSDFQEPFISWAKKERGMCCGTARLCHCA